MPKQDIVNTKQFSDKGNHQFKLLSEYKDIHNKLNVMCLTCGHKFKKAINTSYIYEYFCPKCNELKTEQTKKEMFKKKFDVYLGKYYSCLDSFKGDHTKIRVKHNRCGSIIFQTPNILFSQRISIICDNQDCQNEQIKKEEIGVSISDFADQTKDMLVAKDLIRNEFISTLKRRKQTFEKVHCSFGHRYSINKQHNYHLIKCPICSVLNSDNFRMFETVKRWLNLEKTRSEEVIEEKTSNPYDYLDELDFEDRRSA